MPDGSGFNGPGRGSEAETFVPGPDRLRALRSALGRFATGVTVVTTQSADGPVGITANSFSSLSLDPPLVIWSPARGSRRFPVFAEAAVFSIHVLGAAQGDLAARFVRDGRDFAGLDAHPNAEGVPILPGCLARFDCRREVVHDGGDHALIVGRVLRAAVDDGAPLVFSAGRYGSFTPF